MASLDVGRGACCSRPLIRLPNDAVKNILQELTMLIIAGEFSEVGA